MLNRESVSSRSGLVAIERLTRERDTSQAEIASLRESVRGQLVVVQEARRLQAEAEKVRDLKMGMVEDLEKRAIDAEASARRWQKWAAKQDEILGRVQSALHGTRP